MNKSRFTKWQIVSTLKQAEVGTEDDRDFPSAGHPKCNSL